MIEETIYLNRDNSIDFEMLADGQPEAVQSTTRCVLVCEDEDSGDVIYVDSDADSSLFDWVTYGSSGKLLLKLGSSSLTEGTYVVKIFMYNDNVPNGLFWDWFRLHVRSID